jgi:hypothetical protein
MNSSKAAGHIQDNAVPATGKDYLNEFTLHNI